MRLRPSPTTIAVCCIGLGALAPHCGAQDADQPLAGMPTQEQVRAAAADVAADPNLATTRTVHTLRWAASDDGPHVRSGWVEWLAAVGRLVRGLFRWLAESGRVLLWVLETILAAMLLLFLVRLARGWRRSPSLAKRFVAPSHVRDLDIRPESLPDDIGAAAAALWDRGNQRAALALLYRGAVSKLVHAHGIPIRASSTEGDCLMLAGPQLDSTAAEYLSRLVTTWRNAVYGGLSPATSVVHELCSRFGDALGPRSAVAAGSTAA